MVSIRKRSFFCLLFASREPEQFWSSYLSCCCRRAGYKRQIIIEAGEFRGYQHSLSSCLSSSFGDDEIRVICENRDDSVDANDAN